MPTLEQTLTRGESLTEHLLQQIHMAELPDKEKQAAALIVFNLDGDGYLKDPPLDDIAQEAELTLEEAEAVLRRVQRFDPVGCAARTLAESLLVQAEVRGISDDVLVAMLTKHMPDLEKRNYAKVARDLKVDIEDIYEAAKDIKELDPRPGREYSTDEAQHITPDVYVHKVGDQYFVTVNDDGLPKLRISNYYLSTMKQKDDKAAKEYVQERLKSAKWLIESIQQRQRTIVKVTESILKFQRDFFDKGIAFLKPLILRDVAEDIGMHESTVSRVTTNKYVHTPQGIYELKFFFNSGISSSSGDDLASQAVKSKIKELVDAEDAKRPHSDQKIVELLKKGGINIARRTVAKYREQMGILSSSQRKQVF